jgi:hypothetical protein
MSITNAIIFQHANDQIKLVGMSNHVRCSMIGSVALIRSYPLN